MMNDFIIEKGVLKGYLGNSEIVIIPDSVTSIGESAFNNCTSLTNVTIPDSVISICDYAFALCKNLTRVTIGNSVTSVGDYVFDSCTSLASVTLGNNVTSIGRGAFYDCISLTNVIIPDSVISIGDGAFCFCFNMQSVTIGNSVTNIDNRAFIGCINLTNVIIPDSVKSIGNRAFYNCHNLKSIKHNYKAFIVNGNGNLYSAQNTMQYKLGRTEKLEGELKICNRGFHYCTNIFDIFNHYWGEYDKDYVIVLCDVNENNIQTHEEDSKCCTDEITPIKLLTQEEVITLLNGGDIAKED